MPHGSCFEVIIVGAGSAGCVLATLVPHGMTSGVGTKQTLRPATKDVRYWG